MNLVGEEAWSNMAELENTYEWSDSVPKLMLWVKLDENVSN